MHRFIVFLIGFFYYLTAFGQDQQPVKWRFSVFDNSPAYPVSTLIGLPIHPGIDAARYFNYRVREKSHFYQDARLGYYYHRYMQHGLQLYTEAGYSCNVYHGLHVEAALGLGYLHSIPATQIFTLNNETGKYERTGRLGHPQFMGGPEFILGYDLNIAGRQMEIFTAWQIWIQAPFVAQYVPILPNSAFHLGIGIPFKSSLK